MSEVTKEGYIDVHCHLAAKEFDEDIAEVIARAKEANVLAILAVAIRQTDFLRIMQLSSQYAGFVYPCMGIHPVQGEPPDNQRSVKLSDYEDGIEKAISDNHTSIAAIGEVGLDFSPRFAKGDEEKAAQREVLRRQIDLAKKYDLPLNVHSRSAGRPTIDFLIEHGADKVVMHAFDGRPAIAMRGVQNGFYFSIPPSIVRSEQQKLVKQVPLDHMLLETDSPALGPEKQVRNEPKNLHIACEYIAQIKGIPAAEVMKATTANALKLFPKLHTYLHR